MNKIKQNIKTQTAFAPATVSNLAVGFDILGFPVETMGDEVSLSLRDDERLVIKEIISPFNLPKDSHKNTASVAMNALLKDLNIKQGFDISIKKGIPMGSGLGGSAASAVAAVVALNGFLETPLPLKQLAHYALQGEACATGAIHCDNVIPCLYGGLTLIEDEARMSVINLPIPKLNIVLFCPEISIETKKARAILKPDYPLKAIVKQSQHLAAFIVSLYQNDFELMQHCLKDELIEPLRAQLIPHFYDIQSMALKEGAIACSISGSGPTIFAFAKDDYIAAKIKNSGKILFAEQGIVSEGYIATIQDKGAYLKNEV